MKVLQKQWQNNGVRFGILGGNMEYILIFAIKIVFSLFMGIIAGMIALDNMLPLILRIVLSLLICLIALYYMFYT